MSSSTLSQFDSVAVQLCKRCLNSRTQKRLTPVILNAVKDPYALDPAVTLSNFLTTHPSQKAEEHPDNICTQGILRYAQNDKSKILRMKQRQLRRKSLQYLRGFAKPRTLSALLVSRHGRLPGQNSLRDFPRLRRSALRSQECGEVDIGF